MDDAGIDVLVATSKHNVQYLIGGHRSFFFDSMDAMGLSRYLPVFVYAKGEPQKAGFFGHRLERFQNQMTPFWTAETNTKSSGSVDAMQKAADYVRKLNAEAETHRHRDRLSCRSMPSPCCARPSRTAIWSTRCSCSSASAR